MPALYDDINSQRCGTVLSTVVVITTIMICLNIMAIFYGLKLNLDWSSMS